jgi:hypothetical protein
MQGDFPLHSFTSYYNGKKMFDDKRIVKMQQIEKTNVLWQIPGKRT